MKNRSKGQILQYLLDNQYMKILNNYFIDVEIMKPKLSSWTR